MVEATSLNDRSAHTTGVALPWWRSAVFYEVYIRSFQDSNADGVGDLPGIEQRLSYLRELGVDAIWITPFYPSPMADFGYDVSNYTDVDPVFGTLSDFDLLLKAAHDRNIRVVIDFVPNHTSSLHPWFVESRSSRQNPRRDWYIWADAGPNGEPPNNWPSFFGGSAWTWDEHTGQYYLHLFLDRQPDLNWRNPDVKQAMLDVLDFWLRRGVDGFRLDAITFLVKHPDLLDMPVVPNATGAELVDYHIYVHNQPELHEILRDMRALTDSYGANRVLIGETGSLKMGELRQFFGADLDELQLPMTVLPLHSAWEARAMRDFLSAFYEGLPEGATPHFVFSNHDDKRLISRYGYQHHRSIAMLLLTLPGAPILYYGDEIAMRDSYIPPEKRVDTPGLIAPDVNPGRDPNRTPMQWTPAPHAGFTADSVTPWLPVDSDHAATNVLVQDHDPSSTLSFYRDLLRTRKQSPALRDGSIVFLAEGENDLLAYLRQTESESVLVAINFTSESRVLRLSELSGDAQFLLSSAAPRSGANPLTEISLSPYESVLLRLI